MPAKILEFKPKKIAAPQPPTPAEPNLDSALESVLNERVALTSDSDFEEDEDEESTEDIL